MATVRADSCHPQTLARLEDAELRRDVALASIRAQRQHRRLEGCLERLEREVARLRDRIARAEEACP